MANSSNKKQNYFASLYNNIDFYNKWFNFLMFYIYPFMFYFTILHFLILIVRFYYVQETS